jgi:hypothetical protein
LGFAGTFLTGTFLAGTLAGSGVLAFAGGFAGTFLAGALAGALPDSGVLGFLPAKIALPILPSILTQRFVVGFKISPGGHVLGGILYNSNIFKITLELNYLNK